MAPAKVRCWSECETIFAFRSFSLTPPGSSEDWTCNKGPKGGHTMKLYIVRAVGSKRIIGLFWCSFPELSMLVDEEINPVHAEYCQVSGEASLRWGSKGPKFGVNVPDEDGP